MTTRLQLCAAAILAALFANEATAQYRFLNIVDTTGPFSSFISPEINAHGMVSFSAFLDGGGKGIYVGGDGSLTKVADTLGPFSDLDGASINDSGIVAFQGTLDGGESGIFAYSGGSIVTVVDSSGPFSSLDAASINNAGAVAFHATLEDSPLVEGIYMMKDGVMTTLSEGAFHFIQRPQINDTGAAAFHAIMNVINGPGPGVFAKTDEGISTIELGDWLDSHPRINDEGVVAFHRMFIERGLYTWNGGTPSLYVGADGPFFGFGGSPDINNNGTLVFNAKLDNGKSGIYVGADPSTGTIIEYGDPLFGSTFAVVRSSPRLNDRGDVAFVYELANGVQGVAIAKFVPEPSGALLIILVSVGMGPLVLRFGA